MRKQLFLGVATTLGSLALCSSSAWAARTNYTSELSGPEAATGSATYTFDSDTRVLCGRVTIVGSLTTPATAVVIEPNDDFTAADDIVNVTPAAKPQTGTFSFQATIPADKTGSITGDASFINFLTTAHSERSDGELNGAISPTNDPQETPCPGVTDAGADAGKDASTPTPSTPSTSGGTDTTSGGSSTPDTPDAGTQKAADSGGCATVGDANAASGLGLATIAGMGLALILRGRRRR